MTLTGTEARVCALIAQRQQIGIAKYGTTVQENPLPLLAWKRHLLEELLDAAVYTMREIEAIEGVQEVESEAEPEKTPAEYAPHHAGLMASWQPGQEWQSRDVHDDEWQPVYAPQPSWSPRKQYRLKPQAPYVPSDHVVEPPAETEEPHAELRRTYKPGQVWQFQAASQREGWIDVLGSDGPCEPSWFNDYIYRRHPDDTDEK